MNLQVLHFSFTQNLLISTLFSQNTGDNKKNVDNQRFFYNLFI